MCMCVLSERCNKWVFNGFNFAMLLPDNSFSWLLTAAEKVTSNSLMWFRHNYGNKITRPKKARGHIRLESSRKKAPLKVS